MPGQPPGILELWFHGPFAGLLTRSTPASSSRERRLGQVDGKVCLCVAWGGVADADADADADAATWPWLGRRACLGLYHFAKRPLWRSESLLFQGRLPLELPRRVLVASSEPWWQLV